MRHLLLAADLGEVGMYRRGIAERSRAVGSPVAPLLIALRSLYTVLTLSSASKLVWREVLIRAVKQGRSEVRRASRTRYTELLPRVCRASMARTHRLWPKHGWTRGSMQSVPLRSGRRFHHSPALLLSCARLRTLCIMVCACSSPDVVFSIVIGVVI